MTSFHMCRVSALTAASLAAGCFHVVSAEGRLSQSVLQLNVLYILNRTAAALPNFD